MPTGWWYAAPDSGLMVVDAADGRLLRRMHVGVQAHNSLVSLDGRWLFLGTETMLTMFNARDEQVVLQEGKKLFIFDATQMPPKPKEYVALMWGGHGWICFSLDGQYAWCHTPDIYDARTKQRVALLKDQDGQLFASSKFFEVQFRNGKVVRVGNEFGLGRAQGR